MEHFGLTLKNGGALILPQRGDFEQAQMVDMDVREYHTDWTRMNFSSLKHIKKSPKKYIYELSRAQSGESDIKDHYRIGQAAHLAILEPEEFKRRFLAMPDFGPMQSSKNRALRDEWIASQPKDSIVLAWDELDLVTGMINEIAKETGHLFKKGKFEQTIHFTDQDTGIKCRARLDMITEGSNGPLIVDLKTTKDNDAESFSRDMARFMTHMQMAFYADAVSQVIKRSVDVALVTVEKEPPFDVTVDIMSEEDIELGRQWYKWALGIYGMCLKQGRWPGKAGGNIRQIKLPKWVHNELFPDFGF